MRHSPRLEPAAPWRAAQRKPQHWKRRTRTSPSCPRCPALPGCSAPGSRPERPHRPRQHSDSHRSAQTLIQQTEMEMYVEDLMIIS